MLKLNDFLNKIKDKEEMQVIVKDGFVCIQYNVEKPETFDTPEALECRGVCFDSCTGVCIRRPFEKFFNVNQKEHTQCEYLDSTVRINRVSEKLDGTMIAPFLLNGDIFWGTKRCASEFNDYIKRSGVASNMEDSVRELLDLGLTPIFEYWDGEFEHTNIVIKYPARFMRLLAVRNIETGQYLDLNDNMFDCFEKTKEREMFNTVEEALESIQNEENVEGYVLELSDGTRVKVKTFWYVARHRLLDLFNNSWMMRKLVSNYMLEHDGTAPTVPELIMWNPDFDGNGDDVVGNMTDEQITRLQTEIDLISSSVQTLHSEIINVLSEHADKKSLGLAEDFFEKNVAFGCFSNPKMVKTKLLQNMQKHFSSSKNNRLWESQMFSDC